MNTFRPSKSRGRINQKIPVHRRRLLFICLAFAGFFLATELPAINHPPFVSWIPDQRITSGGFVTQYFRVLDYDGYGVSVTRQSLNTGFLPNSNTYVRVDRCTANDTGCSQTDGWKVSFPNPPPSGPGVATVLIKATENTTAKIGYTSFTVRLDPTTSINPPTVANLPNRAVQVDSNNGYVAKYVTTFVVGDLDGNGTEDICANMNCTTSNLPLPTATSNAPTLFQSIGVALNALDPNLDVAAQQAPRSYTLTATTFPNPTPTPATVTVNVTDPNSNVTSTSFVMQVIAASNAVPSISNTNNKLYEEQNLPATSVIHNFTVADSGLVGQLNQLKVSAFSSNTNLVPNDFVNNLIVTQPDANTGNGSVQIIPVTPLPSPSPGVPQTATITLSVTDDAYTRQATFLYVLRDTTSPVIPFSRPIGVYPMGPPDNLPLDTCLTGSANNLQWDKAEGTENSYDWMHTIDPVIDALLPLPDKDLSLGFAKEPCYIAEDMNHELEYIPWCDTDMKDHPTQCVPTPCPSASPGSFLRAVPWDHHLRDRRNAFLQALASHLNENGGQRMAKISIINTNLAGADQGIRNVILDFDSMDGYMRERLLWAIQDELRNVQDNFPGKLIQIGFFPATDNQGPPPGNGHYPDELWQWLYRDASSYTDSVTGVHLVALFDEFNGVKRPRVSFFQDNLAAARTSNPPATPTPTPRPRSNAPNYIAPSSTTAYTITPTSSFLPSFNWYILNGGVTNDTYNNGIVFESNTVWSNPFLHYLDQGDPKLDRTINGSPNDAMEGAFNGVLSQYLEVYVSDIDQAIPLLGDPPLNATLWAGQLNSWHDYGAYRRGLAPIEGPAGLTVDRANATSNTVSWYPVYGATSYTVQRRLLGIGGNWTTASCSACSPPSATCCLDTLSTGSAYAYRVQATNGTNNSVWSYVAVLLSESTYDGYVMHSGSNYTPYNNAVQPGIRAGTGPGLPASYLAGFVSFPTAFLSSSTILDAKLRLNQFTSGTYLTPGACMVDVNKGSFHGNYLLEGEDYSAPATTVNAFSVTNAGQNGWFTAELPLSIANLNISTTDHTQFRIYFTEGSVGGYEGWYSGESSPNNSQPQLIVRYSTP
jgi:hypothetical protein